MFCDNCGEELREGSRFCSHCGYENKSLHKTDSYKSKQKVENYLSSLKNIIIHFSGWYIEGWKALFSNSSTKNRRIVWCGTHIGGMIVIVCLIVLCFTHQDVNYTSSVNDSYSIEQKEDNEDVNNSYDEIVEEGKEVLSEAIDDVMYAKQVLFSSLQGKWMDKSGLFSITFNDDNTLTIKDASGVIGADLFTYKEVDDHTIALKADSDNFLANIVSLNMDYEVDGKVLTVSIAGMRYELERVK